MARWLRRYNMSLLFSGVDFPYADHSIKSTWMARCLALYRQISSYHVKLHCNSGGDGQLMHIRDRLWYTLMCLPIIDQEIATIPHIHCLRLLRRLYVVISFRVWLSSSEFAMRLYPCLKPVIVLYVNHARMKLDDSACERFDIRPRTCQKADKRPLQCKPVL